MADLQAGSTVSLLFPNFPQQIISSGLWNTCNELVVLSFCFRRQGALVEKGECLFCTYSSVIPKDAGSSTQTATRNFSAEPLALWLCSYLPYSSGYTLLTLSACARVTVVIVFVCLCVTFHSGGITDLQC